MEAVEAPQESKFHHVFGQVWRFAVVGVINTAINFAVLNLLRLLFHVNSGPKVIPLSLAAFTIATVNSYNLNKRWSFHDKTMHDHGRKFTLFLLVSIVGAGINSATIYGITTHIHPVQAVSPGVWLNFANLCAVGISLIWNFIGYKFFVFPED